MFTSSHRRFPIPYFWEEGIASIDSLIFTYYWRCTISYNIILFNFLHFTRMT